MTLRCVVCGTELIARQTKFCSKRCQGLAERADAWSTCVGCGKPIHQGRKRPCRYRKYCSVKCRYPEPPPSLCACGCGGQTTVREGHAMRFIRGHNSLGMSRRQPPKPPEVFWGRVAKTGGCWLWTGTIAPAGYGMVSISGRTQGAHRWSWEFTYGPIPPDKIVMHICDNPPCVRPEHLRLGTYKENIQDMIAKGRWRPKYSKQPTA